MLGIEDHLDPVVRRRRRLGDDRRLFLLRSSLDDVTNAEEAGGHDGTRRGAPELVDRTYPLFFWVFGRFVGLVGLVRTGDVVGTHAPTVGRQGPGIFAGFAERGRDRGPEAARGVGREVGDDPEARSPRLLDGEHDPQFALAARVAVVGECDRPGNRWSFVVVGRVIVESIIDGAAHGATPYEALDPATAGDVRAPTRRRRYAGSATGRAGDRRGAPRARARRARAGSRPRTEGGARRRRRSASPRLAARASSSARDPIGSLCADAHALMRLARGRLSQYVSDSACVTRSMRPVART